MYVCMYVILFKNLTKESWRNNVPVDESIDEGNAVFIYIYHHLCTSKMELKVNLKRNLTRLTWKFSFF